VEQSRDCLRAVHNRKQCGPDERCENGRVGRESAIRLIREVVVADLEESRPAEPRGLAATTAQPATLVVMIRLWKSPTVARSAHVGLMTPFDLVDVRCVFHNRVLLRCAGFESWIQKILANAPGAIAMAMPRHSKFAKSRLECTL
jgi:hypothetical protein